MGGWVCTPPESPWGRGGGGWVGGGWGVGPAESRLGARGLVMGGWVCTPPESPWGRGGRGWVGGGWMRLHPA